ncbi:putative acetyltransferase [uncultured Mediterranean phage uvDeep-CGR2-AD3-C191]|nr:putative acetyltransferase [uncultured Mediterranean phage uvDeep-CGR2-AD3-C191]
MEPLRRTIDLDVTPYQPEDFYELDFSDLDAPIVAIGDKLGLEHSEIAYTARVAEGILFCAGVTELWPGVGQGWVLPSRLVKKYPKLFHHRLKRVLLPIFRSKGFHRVQTTCAVDATRIQWLERIGFEREGLMRGYGPGKEDMLMFAWLRKDK